MVNERDDNGSCRNSKIYPVEFYLACMGNFYDIFNEHINEYYKKKRKAQIDNIEKYATGKVPKNKHAFEAQHKHNKR